MNAKLNVVSDSLALLVVVVALIATPTARAAAEKVLYTFQGQKHGDRGRPEAGLTFDEQGNLFGTTSYWAGNVFELTASGDSYTHTVIHQFDDIVNDGSYPLAGMVFDAAGNLYGTTSYGGDANSWGTVFQLKPSGQTWEETILCTHDCLGDSYPDSEVTIDKRGRIFGTAAGNPVFGTLGSVFELAPASGGSWKTRVLYQFQDNGDGRHPSTTLAMDEEHNFYGMTISGGAYGGGTIFQVSKGVGEWTVKPIYDFPVVFGGTLGGLTFDKAGTTLFGAAHGEIFELRHAGDSWSYRTLYTFGTNEGGVLSRLTIDKAGNLFGTARVGGQPGCANLAGCGSVFKLTKTGNHWEKSTVYEFTGQADGGNPVGGVILDESGNLYGATNAGGLKNCDRLTCGVVYQITP